MISTTERGPVEYPRDAPREQTRIPCTIPVELTHDERTPGFEADAVDLSAGGLSLRSSSLPEVGSMLHCRFDSLPGGTRISGRGEVVWSKLSGERSGEFGLRFTQIDPKAQALISEMIAERVANAGNTIARQPRMATLEIEEVEGPITAKLTRSTGQDVVFEQPLDVLQLGRAVVAHADTALGQGNILRVDLRMDGGTPTLALTVRFSETQEEFGEFDWGETEGPAQHRTHASVRPAPALHAAPKPVVNPAFDAPSEDTQPDLAAPLGVFDHAQTPRATLAGLDARASAQAARATLAGLDPQFRRDTPHSGTHPRLLAPQVSSALAAQSGGDGVGLAGHAKRAKQMDLTFAAEHDEFAVPDDYEEHSGDEHAVQYEAIAIVGSEIPDEPVLHHTQPLRLRAVEVDAPVERDSEDDFEPEADELELHAAGSDRKSAIPEELDPERDTWRPGLAYARRSALVRILRILAAVLNRLETGVGYGKRAARRASQTITPFTRRFLARRQTTHGVAAPTPVVRPRRSAGAAPLAPAKARFPKGSGRLMILAGLMLGCGVLLVYAITPEPGGDHVDLHRAVQVGADGTAEPAEASETTETTIQAATAASEPDSASPATNAAVANARPQPAAAKPAKPAAPAAKAAASPTKPVAAASSSPKTAANAAGAETPAANGGNSFGAKQVPNAARYVLRMSNPIKTLHGKTSPGGFTVTVPNTRALDRAAPIALANATVASAKILNKAGYSELSVRFADGKNPAYRVSAQQAGLEVLIGQ